jgi:hypothetical protein
MSLWPAWFLIERRVGAANLQVDSQLKKPLQGATMRTASDAGGRGAAAVYSIKHYAVRLRWSRRRPYVVARAVVWVAVLWVVGTALLVFVGLH